MARSSRSGTETHQWEELKSYKEKDMGKDRAEKLEMNNVTIPLSLISPAVLNQIVKYKCSSILNIQQHVTQLITTSMLKLFFPLTCNSPHIPSFPTSFSLVFPSMLFWFFFVFFLHWVPQESILRHFIFALVYLSHGHGLKTIYNI